LRGDPHPLGVGAGLRDVGCLQFRFALTGERVLLDGAQPCGGGVARGGVRIGELSATAGSAASRERADQQRENDNGGDSGARAAPADGCPVSE
jgi:hypothetical protein